MAPNPTRAGTAVTYVLAEAARVRASVHDAAGREVVRVTDALEGPGVHAVTWEGRDARGRGVAAGAYFLRIAAGTDRAVRRIVVAP